MIVFAFIEVLNMFDYKKVRAIERRRKSFFIPMLGLRGKENGKKRVYPLQSKIGWKPFPSIFVLNSLFM